MHDLQFVHRCVHGDRQAWDEFVERYSRFIYSSIHHTLRLKGIRFCDQEDIHDIFQAVFLFLIQDNFKKLKTYRAKNGCSLCGWLKRVVINFTIDYLRRQRGDRVYLDEENEQELSLKDVLVDSSVSIRDILCDKEKMARLKECIKRLSTEDKYFLEFYLNQALSLQELKGVLKIERGAIDMRKHRLVVRLRDCFQEKGFAIKS